MKLAKKRQKIAFVCISYILAVVAMFCFPVIKAHAASGTVYSCTINRCYAHPVTGVIEDSGGEASYATGQGMVEGCIYANGILEVTDDGAYYLTIRMSLMDYTSGHSFQVQNVGDSGWMDPSEIGITGNGTDSNGTTADVCMRVPSENSIVRCSMYVDTMGRNVVFYLYPSDYSEGNSTDMNATMITESSEANISSDNNTSTSNDTGISESTAGSSLQSDSLITQNTSNEASNQSESTDKNQSVDDSQKETRDSTKATEKESENTSVSQVKSSALNQSGGLSLSTAQTETESEGKMETKDTFGSHIFQVALAVVISGLILILAAAGVVYFFRRNWKRWGGADDDDE